jgi:hypothetical protein
LQRGRHLRRTFRQSPGRGDHHQGSREHRVGGFARPKHPQFRLGPVRLANLQQRKSTPALRRRGDGIHISLADQFAAWHDPGIHPQDTAGQQTVEGQAFPGRDPQPSYRANRVMHLAAGP